jgi:hypothetical protein
MTPKLKPLDRGYLAGILDGEGHIGLTRRLRKSTGTYNYGARVIIALTSKVIYDLRALVNVGSISFVKRKNPKHKPVYYWTINPNGCRVLLPLLTNLLRVKREQAKLLAEYLGLAKHKNAPDYLSRVAAIYDRLRVLNKTGRRTHGRKVA